MSTPGEEAYRRLEEVLTDATDMGTHFRVSRAEMADALESLRAIHNAGASVPEPASERDPEQSYYLDGPWKGSNVGIAWASKESGPAVLARYGWQQYGSFVCSDRPGREGACRLTFDRTPEGNYKLQEAPSAPAEPWTWQDVEALEGVLFVLRGEIDAGRMKGVEDHGIVQSIARWLTL